MQGHRSRTWVITAAALHCMQVRTHMQTPCIKPLQMLLQRPLVVFAWNMQDLCCRLSYLLSHILSYHGKANKGCHTQRGRNKSKQYNCMSCIAAAHAPVDTRTNETNTKWAWDSNRALSASCPQRQIQQLAFKWHAAYLARQSLLSFHKSEVYQNRTGNNTQQGQTW